MSWYLRKAFQIGPFLRLNLSKLGLGFSVGVKGARVGSGPSGDYVHLGRHGIYYRQNLSTGVDQPQAPSLPQSQSGGMNWSQTFAQQLNTAQSELLQEQWVRAIELYDWLISQATKAVNPGTLFDCHLDRGVALREVGRFEDALRDCEIAVRINPADFRPHHNGGLTYRDRYMQYSQMENFDATIAQADYARATEEFDAALKLNPASVDTLCSRGAHKMVVDHEGGKRDFETALSIAPDCSLALCNLGTFYLNHEDPAQAAKLLEHALRLEPSDSLTRLNLARALVALASSTPNSENFSLTNVPRLRPRVD